MSEHNDAANTDHEFDEPFPSMGIMQPDETPVWTLSRLILAGVVVTVILQVWLGALYYQYNSRENAKKNNAVSDMLGATKSVGLVTSEAEQALAAAPRVADAEKGRIAIPIALAQQQVLAELTENPEADVTGPPPPAPAETAPAGGADAKPEEQPAEEMPAEEKKSEEKKPEKKPEAKPAEEAKEPEAPKEEKPAAEEEKPAEEKVEESSATEEEPAAEPEVSNDE